MLRKIESSTGGVCYAKDKLDLYVDYQDPTKFLFTDKSVTPLLKFKCDHTSVKDIQAKVDEVMPKALEVWNELHKTHDQRERVSYLATDKNINIVVNNVRQYDE